MRLVILQAPSRRDVVWRQAIHEAAHQLDIPSVEYWGGDRVVYPSAHQCVLLTSHFDQLEDFKPDAIVIMAGDAEDISSTFGVRLNILGRGSIPASQWIASVMPLIADGVPVLDPLASELDFPLLGNLAVHQAGDDQLSASEPCPLTVYRNYRNGMVSGGEIPIEFFATDERHVSLEADLGRFDLTGQRRHVLIGPVIYFPAGSYRASFEFELDVEEAQPHLQFEWGVDAAPYSVEEVFEISGSYKVDLVSEWAESVPASFKIYLSRPCFSGTMTWKSFSIDRL